MSVRGVCITAGAMIGLSLAARSGEFVRRYEYWRTGVVRVRSEGIVFRLPPSEPFLKYLLDRGGRDFEDDVTQLLRQELRPGDTCVDVGANVGWFTAIAARTVGPSGKVIAVEPTPATVVMLRSTVAANGFQNVTVLAAAAAAKPGVLKLHLARLGENNSINDLGFNHGTVDVPAVRLDDVITGPVHLIKIDVEGYETEVLAGLSRTLRENPGVRLVIECDQALLKAAGTDAATLKASLEQQGFVLRPMRGTNLYCVRPGT